jgi:D-methionine transport system permease protein
MNLIEWLPRLLEATGETMVMVGVTTLFTLLIGLPLGVLLIVTAPGGLAPAPLVYQILGAIINIGRSLPFIILLVAVVPLTRLITGTSIGSTAAIVPLTLAAIPFFARMCETALREVDRGLIEAAQAMGCSLWQIIVKVLLAEARPGLVLGVTITVINLIGYSAMAGAIGGGGLGDLAIRYGYQRFETGVMLATVALLLVLVQSIQYIGNMVARRLSRR